MGMFRRAKAKPKHGQRGILKMVTKKDKVHCDENSIGDELAPNDQFDLYVPQKRPAGILKNRSFNLVQRRICMQLQRDRKDHESSSANDEDIETSSTASSLTTPSFSIKLLSNEAPKSPLNSDESDKTANKCPCKPSLVDTKSSWNNCCGMSEKTEETDDTNSIVAGRHKTKTAPRKPPLSFWSTMCTPRNEAAYINDDQTSPIILKRPVSLRNENSLFDSLQEEEVDMETETEAGAGTTIAVVEVDSTHDEEPSVVTTNSKWKLKFPTVRSLPKIRSIPKIRSFKLRKKKKKPQYVHPFELD
jgi:hypothetical protein